MKIKYIEASSKNEGKFRIPVVDVRDGLKERREVNRMVRTHNGDTSKFVPSKYGYGTFGPKKY